MVHRVGIDLCQRRGPEVHEQVPPYTWGSPLQKPVEALSGVGFTQGIQGVSIVAGSCSRLPCQPSGEGRTQTLPRCERGSNNQRKLRARLARLRHRETVRNRNECHRITTEIVRNYDLIAVEDLRIANMTRSARGTVERPRQNVAAKAGLNRSVMEQSWGIILSQLEYKAAWYGRTFVRVDTQRTSQTCSSCGAVSAENRKNKKYECGDCSLRTDADTNAAVNILAHGLSATGVGITHGLAA